MSEAVIVALITGGLGLVGTFCGVYFGQRKTTALILYRIEQLEAKVNKHNNLIDRTYKLEEKQTLQDEKIKVANNRIKDLEERID